MIFYSLYITFFFSYYCFINSERLEHHSFEGPFTDVDHSGSRIVSRHWRASGETSIANNYIRLTPERQSKKGALWSRKSLNVPAFSSILKFRISGQGKNFFGDGIALWIVQQGYYNEGDVHGFQEKFTGIGIIFDTFKNTENIAAHRDVTILINDGETTLQMMTDDVQGCNINVRYHAERADFSVLDASRAKVIVNETSLQVFIDARNNGEWTPCVNISDIKLPKNWVRKAHLGLTATTGQLVDNHDVLALMSYSDFEVMEMEEETFASKKFYEVAPSDEPTIGRLEKIERTLNEILGKHDFFDHHIEHEIDTLDDRVDNIQSKLDAFEKSLNENGVASVGTTDIAPAVKKEVEGSISGRLSKLEKSIKDELNKKISRLESTVNSKSYGGGGGGSSWKIPFFFLLFLFVAAGVGGFFFYQHLLRKWKLP